MEEEFIEIGVDEMKNGIKFKSEAIAVKSIEKWLMLKLHFSPSGFNDSSFPQSTFLLDLFPLFPVLNAS